MLIVGLVVLLIGAGPEGGVDLREEGFGSLPCVMDMRDIQLPDHAMIT